MSRLCLPVPHLPAIPSQPLLSLLRIKGSHWLLPSTVTGGLFQWGCMTLDMYTTRDSTWPFPLGVQVTMLLIWCWRGRLPRFAFSSYHIAAVRPGAHNCTILALGFPASEADVKMRIQWSNLYEFHSKNPASQVVTILATIIIGPQKDRRVLCSECVYPLLL